MALILLRNATTYTPALLGKQDILISADKVIAIAASIDIQSSIAVEEIDCSGNILCPGFVDSLTHITGGGGEGGFATRTPEMQLSDAIVGGVTTVTGALGTDAVLRTHHELVAKVKALQEEGLSAYFYTGNYHYPVKTLTGSIQQDIMLIDECIGIGEIAIADHRGSQMSWQEMAKVAAQARVGGMCAKKSGVVMVHVGSGKDKLNTLFDVAEFSNIPLTQFYPTHINRNGELLAEGIRFAKAGGTIDFTASTTPELLAAGEVSCAKALTIALQAGVDANNITFSTDGHASLPEFDANGQLISLKVGAMTSLLQALQCAVLEENIELETALKAITQNPARRLKLSHKGELKENSDADLLLLDPQTLEIDSVVARGQWLMREQKLLKKGLFEK